MSLYTIGKYARPVCDGLGAVVVFATEAGAREALDNMTANGVDTEGLGVWPVRVRD